MPVAGPVEPALRQMYGAGLPENVELLGPLSSADVDRELSAADVFCLPSLEEGFLVFAGGDGRRPHVCGDTGGVWWRSAGRQKRSLVPPMDVWALVTALDGISADRSRLPVLGEAARVAVQDGYSWRDYGDRAVAAYEVLCPDRSRPQARPHHRYPPPSNNLIRPDQGKIGPI